MLPYYTMKLKTLKDFGEYNDFKQTDIYTELREEAIKWVKKYKWETPEDKANIGGWIIHFFNLTEEDLK